MRDRQLELPADSPDRQTGGGRTHQNRCHKNWVDGAVHCRATLPRYGQEETMWCMPNAEPAACASLPAGMACGSLDPDDEYDEGIPCLVGEDDMIPDLSCDCPTPDGNDLQDYGQNCW